VLFVGAPSQGPQEQSRVGAPFFMRGGDMASQWFVIREGQKHGPFNSSQLKALAASGNLGAVDLVWKEGLQDWVPASRLSGLFPEGSLGRPEIRPELPADAAAATSRSRLSVARLRAHLSTWRYRAEFVVRAVGKEVTFCLQAVFRLCSLLASLVYYVWTVQKLRRDVFRANRELAKHAVSMNVGDPMLRRRLQTNAEDSNASPCSPPAEREAIMQLLAADVINQPDLVTNEALIANVKSAQVALRLAESQIAEIRQSLGRKEKLRGRRIFLGILSAGAIAATVALFAIPRSVDEKASAAQRSVAERTDGTRATDLANTNVSVGSLLDLETEVKAAGFSALSDIELRKYVIYGSFEKYKARADQRLDQFSEVDPKVASSSYAVSIPADIDEPGFFLFGPGHRSSHIAVRVPFRIDIDTRDVTCTGAIQRIAPYLADHRQAWFLTKSGTLARCNSASDRMLVVRNDGVLYYAENPWYPLVMIEVGFDDVREFVLTERPQVRLEIERFSAYKPSIWGFYNASLLGSEFDRYDCAAIHRSFDVGLDVGDAPGYFANDKLAPSRVVGGVLKKLTLISNDGRTLGTATIGE
jgi:hypothetical protein